MFFIYVVCTKKHTINLLHTVHTNLNMLNTKIALKILIIHVFVIYMMREEHKSHKTRYCPKYKVSYPVNSS